MDYLASRRILIVDDNDSIHDDFRKILTPSSGLEAAVESAAASIFDEPTGPKGLLAPFELASAYQGQEALSLVESSIQDHQPFAIAFVDVRMPPGWNGVETVRKLWEVDRRLQVVICTAYSDYSWAEMIEELGEADSLLILKKPFDNIEVRQLACSLTAKWNLARQAELAVQQLESRVREQTQAVKDAHEETIYRLVRACLCRDEETGAHIRRTGLFSELLAAAAGWPEDQTNQIRIAAPMHDVGKIGIPDAILRKPGRLTAGEYSVLRDHSQLGAQMLAGSTSPILRMAQEIAMCHHEWWDGTGYPRGLVGEAIPEAARIVAIVDVYDAITHDRIYRKRLSEVEVKRIMMEGRGSHFDPRLLDLFMSLLPEIQTIAQCIPDETGESAVPTFHTTISAG